MAAGPKRITCIEKCVRVKNKTANFLKKVCDYLFMKLAELKGIIISQREEMEEVFRTKNIIEREVDRKRLKGLISHPNVLAILGVRRCGKSILSWQMFSGENFAYVNFDDERLIDLETEDLNTILQAFQELYGRVDRVILDEPQNVRGWELFVNRLRRTRRIIVTGSNSHILSGELATALTGRYVDFTLLPFSFREFIQYRGLRFHGKDIYSVMKAAEMKRQLEEYMKSGGFPEKYTIGREILVRIYGDIVEKDIVRRLAVKKRKALREFVKLLISSTAREFSLRRLAKTVEIRDVHTLKNWLEAVENSYLGFILTRYSPRLKEQMIAPKKFYAMDTGMANSVSFHISKDMGRTIENLVAIELMRRKNYWNADMEIYYWKDHQQREVDFVIKEVTGVRELIQVTYATGKDEIEKREIRALLKASEELKCKNLKIITWDHEDTETIDNRKIIYIPLWKWLLEK